MSGVRHTFLAAPALPPGRPRLIVTGFMGTGKTEAGREAARLLGMPVVDLDGAVERRAGMPVGEVFERLGEESFRRLEREAVADAARLSGAVVATGGGAPLDRSSFDPLAQGSVVAVLGCAPEELDRRLAGGAPRPLLAPEPGRRIRELLSERAAAYEAAGQALDTTGRSAEDVAHELADRYRTSAGEPGDPVPVPVTGPDGTYRVVIGHGALVKVGEKLSRALPNLTAAAVVADGSIPQDVIRSVVDALGGAGVRTLGPLILPPGEAAKTVDTVADLWRRLRQAGLDPAGAVVAMGGGAALDAAGFAAATFARGVALANVPTTLLAMVDAGFGGKVGVDHAGVKNLAGAFHHPALVVADPGVLESLPVRALRAGFAECVKAAAVASPLVLDVLEDVRLDDRGIPASLAWTVEQAVRIKSAYVAADPRDRGLRHALNLGHTFAHALESATGYDLLHGEAVAIGLAAACRLGVAFGVTPSGLELRLTRLLLRLGVSTRPPEGLDPEQLLDAMAGDKKRRGGRAIFVVPAPGGAELLEGVDPANALAALMGDVPALAGGTP